ncbi:MAG: small subunit ribosomal protein S8 [Parcubacteria group bacterium Athens1014_10]|nr:MAG: small subunit ribosomal protein S8 [Parcubacteria group bacterium Athens1014_10]TSD05485.1 MAG: small subunit ribosomal protein S8 [Parcubacteria group bacterium Athens0714_12]
MTTTDPIAEMLTIIRNAVARKRSEVVFPFSKTKFAIAKILEKENFVGKVEKKEENYGQIKISLKYDKEHKSVIQDLKRISKSGRRIYRGTKEIPRVVEGPGLVVVSTSRGLMTGKDARKRKLGGEIVCKIYS